MDLYFVASKKNHHEISVQSCDGICITYTNFVPKQSRPYNRPMNALIKFLRTAPEGITLVSFGYTFTGLSFPGVDLSRFNLVYLKDLFRQKFPDAPEKFSRGEMAKRLGLDVTKYEPNYPKASSYSTTNLYIAIYEALMLLEDPETSPSNYDDELSFHNLGEKELKELEEYEKSLYESQHSHGTFTNPLYDPEGVEET